MIRAKRVREKAGLTQQKAAQELGISRTVLSNIENGVRPIDAVTLMRMMKVYKTTADKIIDLDVIDVEFKMNLNEVRNMEGDISDFSNGKPENLAGSYIEKILKNLVFLNKVDNTVTHSVDEDISSESKK